MNLQFFIKLLADGIIVPIVLLAGYALLLKVPEKYRFEIYSRILMAGLTSYLIAKLLGSVYQPSQGRPFELLGVKPGASYLNNPGFPSDHILLATFLTLSVWFETRQRKIAITMGVLTLTVGLGRVLALVHTPLDVIGGIIIACLGSLWYLEQKKYFTKTKYRQNDKKVV